MSGAWTPPTRLSGWGRYPVIDCPLATPRDPEEGVQLYTSGVPFITRGNGRAYGDPAVNASGVLHTRRMNHLLGFDPSSGLLTCESGVHLADVIAVFLPRGWFPLITPGTRFVTIGGLIAADVHGKNHHRAGSFCDHLTWVELILPSGEIVRCSREAHTDLFAATCGGMGLTGTIVRAAFQLTHIETPFIQQETRHAANLDQAFAIFEASQDQPYSVAWIDGLATGAAIGRSVVFLGKHLIADDQPGGRSPGLDLIAPGPSECRSTSRRPHCHAGL